MMAVPQPTHRMARAAGALLLCAALLTTSGCSIQNRLAITQCQFNVRTVRVDRITPFELNMTVVLGIYNPNTIDVVVDRFEYVILINGLKLVDGASQQDIRIGVNQSADLPIGVRANVLDVAQVIQRLRGGGDREITVRGTYYVRVPWGVHPFPVEVRQRF